MREMLAPNPPSSVRAWVTRWRITDGRFSGGTYGLVVGHVAPEAAVPGGTIALVHEGDSITIAAEERLYCSST